MHGEGLVRLHRRTNRLVRRTQSTQVLRVERPEGCRDGGPDPDNAFFHAWPKHSDPKLASKKQLGTAHRGRAAGMRRAIALHLFDRRSCVVRNAAPTGNMTVSVHLRLQRAPGRDWMGFSNCGVSARSDFHLWDNPPCARLCDCLPGRYILKRAAIPSNYVVRRRQTGCASTARSVPAVAFAG
jgi:hypothetical protein